MHISHRSTNRLPYGRLHRSSHKHQRQGLTPARTAFAIVLAALSTTGLVTACSADGEGTSAAANSDVVKQIGFEGLDARQIIDKLDRTPVSERSKDYLASVGTDELKLTTTDAETTLPLPDDLNYVSIAPYVKQTHDCFYHSLTTCLGELGDTPVHVTITDDAGKTIVDENTTTFNNGFVGFWLPEDIHGTITIHQGDKSGSTQIDTSDEGATCVTDLQLA